MKDQEYYHYTKKDYGRDSVEEVTVEQSQQQESIHTEPQEEAAKPKKKGCLGCTIMIISIVMIIGGLITIIAARSSAPEKSMPVNVQGEKIVIIQDVNPDNKYGISMKITLAGNNYYTYEETVTTRSHGSNVRKTVTRTALVHRVPYTVKAIRESNGEVVYDFYDEFENGNDEVVKTQSEYLKNSPGISKDLKKFDFTDKVRFEFIVNIDEKYKTVVEKGEVAVYQMSSARNATWQIALLIMVLGVLGLTIGFIVATIQFFVLAARESAKNKNLKKI